MRKQTWLLPTLIVAGLWALPAMAASSSDFLCEGKGAVPSYFANGIMQCPGGPVSDTRGTCMYNIQCTLPTEANKKDASENMFDGKPWEKLTDLQKISYLKTKEGIWVKAGLTCQATTPGTAVTPAECPPPHLCQRAVYRNLGPAIVDSGAPTQAVFHYDVPKVPAAGGATP